MATAKKTTIAPAAEEAAATTKDQITARVKIAFKDKNTGVYYPVGKEITVTKARFKEMNSGKVRVVRI